MAKLTKDEIIEAVSNLSVLELSELVKALEEKFGVSAAPVAAAAAPAAAIANINALEWPRALSKLVDILSVSRSTDLTPCENFL